MKFSYLMIVSAVIDAIYGIALVLIPEFVIALYGGMAMEKPTEQLFGAYLIGFAVLNWFARNSKEGEALRAIILTNLVTNTLGLILALIALLSGVWGAFGWSTVVILLLLALGFAYFLFVKPGGAMASARR